MTLQELYASIGGNYQEMFSRVRMEQFIERLVVRFLDDTSCRDTIDAWAAKDEGAAFKAAHTAKGVCANLSITSLYKLADQICEALRPGNEKLREQTDVDALVDELSVTYNKVVADIEAYKIQG